MNQTDVFAQFDDILQKSTNMKLQKNLDKLQNVLYDLLDKSFHQDIDDVIEMYRYDVRTKLKLTSTRKTRVKKEISPLSRCMARIGLGSQCSRSRADNADFCKSHCLSRPYGRIDVAEPPEKKMAKRRGRRSKNDKDYTIEDLDVNMYVQAILININDEPYLMDQYNILYQFSNNNEIVGHVVDDRVEWY